MVGVPHSCALLGRFAIGAWVLLLWQHSVNMKCQRVLVLALCLVGNVLLVRPCILAHARPAAIFQVNLGYPVSLFSSSTCSGREPLEISVTGHWWAWSPVVTKWILSKHWRKLEALASAKQTVLCSSTWFTAGFMEQEMSLCASLAIVEIAFVPQMHLFLATLALEPFSNVKWF